MEQKWVIGTADNHKIYGVKNYSHPPKTKAIFIVHGLTSSMNDYALKRAADGYFNDKQLSYHSYGTKGSVRIFARGSEHCFHEENTCDILLNKTKEWFEKSA